MESPAKKKAKTEITTAVCVSEFKQLLEQSTIFIDKTLLIKDFLEIDTLVLLITCPRRWGKSINMDMIKTFLEIEVNEYGEKYQDKESTSNYQLFSQGIIASGGVTDYLEKPLNISLYSDIVKEYQGEYPVIYVDFKNVKGNNFDDIFSEVKMAINNSFKQHGYIFNVLDRTLKNDQADYAEKIKAKNSLGQFIKFYCNSAQEATESDIKFSLKFLSELLQNLFKKQVYVLMDAYDTPINNILQNNQFSSEDLDETFFFFSHLLLITFKGNKFLQNGLITGIFHIADLFFDANNVMQYNFLNNPFARYYGFNQDEITSLFKRYKISPELSQHAKEWYNGYRVRDSTLQIYNPYSIVNFLNNKKIMNYWEETGNTDFIEKLFKVDDIKNKIHTLINKEDVLIYLKENLRFYKDDFLTLKTLVDQNTCSSRSVDDLFFSYIFTAGYLTATDMRQDCSFFSSAKIRLPNREVTAEFSKKLKSYYQQLYSIPPELFNDATEALEELFKGGVHEKFQQVLDNIFLHINCTKTTDTEQSGTHPNEKLFHSIVNIIAIQSSCTKFGTEVSYKNEERGRADIVLINDDVQLGMIMEIKYDLETDALTQAKQYAPIFERYSNIKQIRYVGMNVKKDCKVAISEDLKDNQYYNQSGNSTSNEYD